MDNFFPPFSVHVVISDGDDVQEKFCIEFNFQAHLNSSKANRSQEIFLAETVSQVHICPFPATSEKYSRWIPTAVLLILIRKDQDTANIGFCTVTFR
jgi:hypothetical protein